MFKNFKIVSRLWLLVSVAIVALILCGGDALLNLRRSMLEDRQVKTRHVVETAYGVMNYFDSLASEKKLSLEDAKKNAMNLLRKMRYEEKEYFWVNTLEPRMVMHPMKPELDGKDLTDIKDPTGKHIFVEFSSIAKNGGGFVEYLWPKPGSDKPVGKVSYVKLFEPWGMVIGSGIYLDDVAVAFLHEVKRLTLIFSFVILVILTVAWFISRKMIADHEKTVKAIDEAMRSYNMLEKFPINIMTANPDGKLNYLNKNSIDALKKLQKHLSGNVENYIGSQIDIFHEHPGALKNIYTEPSKLPYKTLFTVGPEKIDFNIVAIFDQEGAYQGPMATWDIATDRVELIDNLTKSSNQLYDASVRTLEISNNLSAAAEQTSAQANTASVASEEVNAGVQTVAGSMEEMVASIKEITKTTNEASTLTASAMTMALNADKIINELGASSQDIGNVTKVISSIAQQTNLLALNATIEAARAGEAGKGFAVVANEVKELAKQTAKATSDITKKIETIQEASRNAVSAIGEISIAIERVNGFTANIASSVEEQAATTDEVTRIVTESAEGVKQISENINQVSEAAASTGRDAGNAQVASKLVGEIATLLKEYVNRLKV